MGLHALSGAVFAQIAQAAAGDGKPSLVVHMMKQYLGTLGWALVGAISMAIGLGIALKVFTVLTPGIDEIEELKKGNIGVAIVIAAVVISMGIVVAVMALPESILN